MNLETRVSKLEAVIDDTHLWDLTLLTDAELISLEAVLCQVATTGKDASALMTPELVAALNRAKR
jgi:hypothetical protein